MSGGLGRRGFLAVAAGMALSRGTQAPAQPAQQRRRVPIIDGIGEIRLDYEPVLLDAIRESGLTACVVTVGDPALQGAAAFQDMEAELLAYDRHIAANPQRLSRATSLAEIERAAEGGTLALLYYTQNASPIQDDLGRLAALHALGVRIVQLTYNSRNLLGDGCLERTNAGLSRFGVDAVARMNELRILVDVSHCGEATTRDAIALSKKPVAVNHSGCRAVFDHPRNKTDEALRALAERGGVIGIYQINPYLGPRERNSLDDYLAHVDHAVKIAGIEHVGIGSDREHRVIPDTPEEKQKLVDELSKLGPATAQTVRWPFFIGELNHPRRMRTIADGLARRGYTSDQVDKILGGNLLRLFGETIG